MVTNAKLVEPIEMGFVGDGAWWEILLPPCPKCGGDLVWYEAGYVPGTRKCMGIPLKDEITSVLDARLPQPPYKEVDSDNIRQIVSIIGKYRNVCKEDELQEVDGVLIRLLMPYRQRRYDPANGCGEIYQVEVENGHAILYRCSWED